MFHAIPMQLAHLLSPYVPTEPGRKKEEWLRGAEVVGTRATCGKNRTGNDKDGK